MYYLYLFICYCRAGYSVELVEPDTPWREDVRILSQKNQHHIPKEKIARMLEKQKVPINIAYVVEECRRKMNLGPQSRPSPAAALMPNKTLVINQNNRPEPQAQREVETITRIRTISASGSIGNLMNGDGPLSKSPLLQEENRFLNAAAESFISANDVFFNFHRQTEPPLQVPLASSSATAFAKSSSSNEMKPSTCDVSIQTSLSDATLCIIPARNRSIQLPSRIVPDFRKKSSKLLLDKGCNTEEIVEDLASHKALSKNEKILKLYFPTLDARDLADQLQKCKGDIDW